MILKAFLKWKGTNLEKKRIGECDNIQNDP